MKTLLTKYKKQLIYFSSFLLFIFYFYFTDPDNSWASLVITLQIIVVSIIGIVLLELLPDVILDPIFGNEKKLVEIAERSPEGAAEALKAKSYRLIAYSIIIAANVIAFTST